MIIVRNMLFVLLLVGWHMAQAENAVLKIDGFRNNRGFAAVSIFSEDEQRLFPSKSDHAAKTFYIALEGKTSLELKLDELPEGVYAIAVMHDEDGDKSLKTIFGIPREGFGFSNNPTIYFGPPSFEKASVSIRLGTILNVSLRYFL